MRRLFAWLFPSTDRELHKLRAEVDNANRHIAWLQSRHVEDRNHADQMTRLSLALVTRVDALEKRCEQLERSRYMRNPFQIEA